MMASRHRGARTDACILPRRSPQAPKPLFAKLPLREWATLDCGYGRAEGTFNLAGVMLATRYQHTLIYRINGVHLGEQEEAELVADPATGFRAVLSTDPDPYCFEPDRYTAISNTLLNAVFRQPGAATFDEGLRSQLEEIRESRKRKFGNGPYLVLMKEDKVEVSPPPYKGEKEEYVIWLDGAAREPLRQASKTQIRAALTALALPTEDASGFDKVSDTVIFFQSDGKPIYSYTSCLTTNPSVLRALPPAAIESVSDWYQTVARAQELERVSCLLVSSLQTKGDTMRSFLAV
jgi:hypothetical protein